MSAEATQEPHGDRRDGPHDPERKQTRNPEQHDDTDVSSEPPVEQDDYFQRSKQDVSSNSTRRIGQSAVDSSDRTKLRPAMASRPSTSASYTLDRMHEDPKTSDKMSRVVAQLDDEGLVNLEQLVSEFAKQRSKPKGQLTCSNYRDQNPWYDQERSKPNFSLGDTLPHVGEDSSGERIPGRDQVCASPKSSSYPHPSQVTFQVTPFPRSRPSTP